MKYTLNNKAIELKINQQTISEAETELLHQDFIDPALSWYQKGYTPIDMSKVVLKNIRTQTSTYINRCVQEVLHEAPSTLTQYHHMVSTDEAHMLVLDKIGKVLPTRLVGIDENYLAKKIQQACNIKDELACLHVCDLRIFRPYTGGRMDNNPLHRDTWLPILNNCINVYIPIAGSNHLSSLSVLPGSHLWDRGDVYRTTTNAQINGVQYGLPSISTILRDYKLVRPRLSDSQVLLFSSHMIHGGAVNLNKDITRVSVEIRFWIKDALTPEQIAILRRADFI